MIGVFKNYNSRKNNIAGFRVIDTETYVFKDISYDSVLKAMLKGLKIYNLKLRGDKVISSNGSIDRYPVVNARGVDREKNDTYVAIVSHNDDFYDLCDINGIVTTYKEREITSGLTYNYTSYKVANLCIREKETGKEVDIHKIIRRIQDDSEFNKKYWTRIKLSSKGREIYKVGVTKEEKEIAERYRSKLALCGYNFMKIGDGMELLQVKGKFDYFEIPKGIKYIAPDAFFYSEVNTLKMNEDLKVIADYSIYTANIDNTELLNIPKNLVHIGRQSIPKYLVNTDVKLPENSSYRVIMDGLFSQSNITRIVIPSNITIIGYGAFEYCTSLEEVKVSPNVYKVGRNIFHDCDNLVRIDFRCKIKEISDWAFYGCVSLEKLLLNDNIECIGERAFEDCCSLKEGYIPWKNIKYIKRNAFERCDTFKKIVLNNVREIGNEAFANCSGLEEVIISSKYKDLKLGDNIFKECIKLRKLTIPSQFRKIGVIPLMNKLGLNIDCEIKFLD